MKKLYITTLAILVGLGLYTTTANIDFQAKAQPTAPAVTQKTTPTQSYKRVNALAVVANPYNYLNQRIEISAKFDKFSTLGLDYPPAKRDHENYISFLIQRPDVTDHNIPLSEMKIFLKKEIAEKHIDLNAGDEILFKGKVFSVALGDPWIDVEEFEVIKHTPKAEDDE